MFGVKTYFIKTLMSRVKFNSAETHFPNTSQSLVKLFLYLFFVRREASKKYIVNNLGWLSSSPSRLAVLVYALFLDKNINHLGTWTGSSTSPWATQKLEKNVIAMTIDLLGGNPKALDGYITSGATEGNLFAGWTGVVSLQKRIPRTQIALLGTELTHYSLKKTASILGIYEHIVPLDPTSWGISPSGLKNQILTLRNRGYRGFLIPLTLGYTITGSSDDISSIIKIVKEVEKETGVSCFLWLDAALNGLIVPFINRQFAPFSSSYIHAFVVDFHKFGGAPIPAGVIIYKKSLQKLVQQTTNYFPQIDASILGSRPGSPAAAIWTLIHTRGSNGYTALVKQQMENKAYFLSQLRLLLPETEIITHEMSLTCGVIFHSLPQKKVPKRIEEKYGLFTKLANYTFTSGVRKEKIYKFYFLPHITKSTVTACLNDIAQLGN